jgi:uncharacterized membrane protein
MVAALVFALALVQVARAEGRARSFVELLALAAYGLGLEVAAMRAFSSHVYARGWNATAFGVPLAVAAMWAALIPSALALAARLGFQSPLGRALAASVVAIDLDLLMEPVAVAARLWRWTPAGGYIGVPAGNFVGWAVIVGVYAIGAEWGRSTHRPLWLVALARVGLSAAAIVALLAVGTLWTRLGAESTFTGPLAWTPWVLGVLAGIALSRRVRPVAGDGFAGSLARPGAGAPAAAFLLPAALFSAQAVLCARPGVLLAALGAVVALGLVVRSATRTT